MQGDRSVRQNSDKIVVRLAPAGVRDSCMSLARLAKVGFWFASAVVLIGLGAIVVTSCAGSYESSYPMTAVDAIEMKTLPAARVMETSSPQGYFAENNGMFMKLFRYLQANELAMTVPVEGGMQPGTMRFFVAKDVSKELKPAGDVKLVDLPERKVVSLGARGGYERDSIAKLTTRLASWLKDHPELKTVGEPYAVFWDGPFIPAGMRRLEMHQVVK
jgi:hypothetical protein